MAGHSLVGCLCTRLGLPSQVLLSLGEQTCIGLGLYLGFHVRARQAGETSKSGALIKLWGVTCSALGRSRGELAFAPLQARLWTPRNLLFSLLQCENVALLRPDVVSNLSWSLELLVD